MAILIKSTENKKILISGTEIELKEVYGRIRFLGDYDGKNIEGEVSTFANQLTFQEGKPLFTDVPIGNFKVTITEDENQSVEIVHKYAKEAYEQMGYEVEVLL